MITATSWTHRFQLLYIDEVEKRSLKSILMNLMSMRIMPIYRMHALNEPGCAVKAALNEGKISSIRYDNYKALYEEQGY